MTLRPRLVFALFRKDLFDALRDSRILISLLLPLLLGISYNAIFPDRPRTTLQLAYAVDGDSGVPESIRQRLPQSFELKAERLSTADEVRERVRRDAQLGLAIPAGFDAAVRAGAAPRLRVFTREQIGGGANTLLLTLDAVLREMAGQRPPAAFGVEPVKADSGPVLLGELGFRRYVVLATLIMMVSFIALIVVPIILTEEIEKRTIEALTLVLSPGEVVVAKALVGLAYMAIAVPLLLITTRLLPADVPAFALAVALLGVALVGFGLLIGGLFRSATQVYTWSGLFLLPVLTPPFLVAMDLPKAVEVVLVAFPTSQGMRVAANALAGRPIFADPALGVAVIAAWGAAAYALLVWRLRSAAD